MNLYRSDVEDSFHQIIFISILQYTLRLKIIIRNEMKKAKCMSVRSMISEAAAASEKRSEASNRKKDSGGDVRENRQQLVWVTGLKSNSLTHRLVLNLFTPCSYVYYGVDVYGHHEVVIK